RFECDSFATTYVGKLELFSRPNWSNCSPNRIHACARSTSMALSSWASARSAIRRHSAASFWKLVGLLICLTPLDLHASIQAFAVPAADAAIGASGTDDREFFASRWANLCYPRVMIGAQSLRRQPIRLPGHGSDFGELISTMFTETAATLAFLRATLTQWN